MPLVSLEPDGEKLGPPGVMPEPACGDQTLRPWTGVALCSHGVRWGLVDGVAAFTNISPVDMPIPRFIGISIPYLHFSASNRRSKHPATTNIASYDCTTIHLITFYST